MNDEAMDEDVQTDLMRLFVRLCALFTLVRNESSEPSINKQD